MRAAKPDVIVAWCRRAIAAGAPLLDLADGSEAWQERQAWYRSVFRDMVKLDVPASWRQRLSFPLGQPGVPTWRLGEEGSATMPTVPTDRAQHRARLVVLRDLAAAVEAGEA